MFYRVLNWFSDFRKTDKSFFSTVHHNVCCSSMCVREKCIQAPSFFFFYSPCFIEKADECSSEDSSHQHRNVCCVHLLSIPVLLKIYMCSICKSIIHETRHIYCVRGWWSGFCLSSISAFPRLEWTCWISKVLHGFW